MVMVFPLFRHKVKRAYFLRELAEWPIAVVLKTIEPKGSEGSNPSLSDLYK